MAEIIKFDTRGNLKSDKNIVESNMLELEEHFVRHFNKESLRVEIVNNFLSFIRAIKNEGLKSFTIWIDGSFISNKPNPKDLDFLLLIENDQQKSIREILKKEEFNDKLSKRTLI